MKYNIVLQNTHSSQKHTCNISNFYTHVMHVVTHQLYCKTISAYIKETENLIYALQEFIYLKQCRNLYNCLNNSDKVFQYK